jgi:hypothetical protein
MGVKCDGGGGKYISYTFLNLALEGGEWSASRPGRVLPPGKGPPETTVQVAGWAPEPVSTQRLEVIPFPRAANKHRSSIKQSDAILTAAPTYT